MVETDAGSQLADKLTTKDIPNTTGSVMLVEDSLTRVFYNPGACNFLYSGVSFFDMWYKPFLDGLLTSAVCAISTFDDSTNVPREKIDTQLARIIAGKKQIEKHNIPTYDESWEFCDDGIYDPKHKSSSLTMFDSRGVQASKRTLKRKLWNYLFTRLRQNALPDDRVLYFEFESISAWKFEGTGQFQRALDTAHNHAEGDVSVPFWLETQAFRKNLTAIIRTTDGDVAPMIVYAIEQQKKRLSLLNEEEKSETRQPIYWRKRANHENKGHVIEMRAFAKVIELRWKWSSAVYMIFCILCGCDFFEKKILVHGFGAQKIWAAVDAAKEEIAAAWDIPWHIQLTESQQEKQKEALRMVLRHLYQAGLGAKAWCKVVENKNNRHLWGKKPEPMSWIALGKELREKAGPKQLPMEDKFMKGYQQISFTFRYWRDRSKWAKEFQFKVEFEMPIEAPVGASSAAAAAASADYMHVEPAAVKTSTGQNTYFGRALDSAIAKATATGIAESKQTKTMKKKRSAAEFLGITATVAIESEINKKQKTIDLIEEELQDIERKAATGEIEVDMKDESSGLLQKLIHRPTAKPGTLRSGTKRKSPPVSTE